MAQHSDLSTVVLNRYSTSWHRHNDRCASRVKGTEQILTAAAHGALAVTALDVDGVAPAAACGAQELAEMQSCGSKTRYGQNITPIGNCAQYKQLGTVFMKCYRFAGKFS